MQPDGPQWVASEVVTPECSRLWAVLARRVTLTTQEGSMVPKKYAGGSQHPVVGHLAAARLPPISAHSTLGALRQRTNERDDRCR